MFKPEIVKESQFIILGIQNRPSPIRNATDDFCHGDRKKEDDRIQSGRDTNELLLIAFCGRTADRGGKCHTMAGHLDEG